jgi:hypothetical protein
LDRPHLSITQTKGKIMDGTAKQAAMLAVYQAAREALLNAASVADQAVQAIMEGNANLAVGTAMEAQTDAALACKMFDAAMVLHRAGRG